MGTKRGTVDEKEGERQQKVNMGNKKGELKGSRAEGKGNRQGESERQLFQY